MIWTKITLGFFLSSLFSLFLGPVGSCLVMVKRLDPVSGADVLRSRKYVKEETEAIFSPPPSSPFPLFSSFSAKVYLSSSPDQHALSANSDNAR